MKNKIDYSPIFDNWNFKNVFTDNTENYIKAGVNPDKIKIRTDYSNV